MLLHDARQRLKPLAVFLFHIGVIMILLFVMSDATIAVIVGGAVTIVGMLLTGIFAYIMKKLEKVALSVQESNILSKTNGEKADIAADKAVIAASKAEEAKTTTIEINRKQDALIEQTDLIHTATNSNLEKLTRKIEQLEFQLKESQAKSLSLAESSIPKDK